MFNFSSSLSVAGMGVFALGSGNAVLRILEVASALILLRWLTLYEFGTDQLTLAAFGIFSALTFSGISSLTLSEVSRGNVSQNDSEDILWFYSVFKVLTGVFLWAAMFFGSDFLKSLFDITAPAVFIKIISWIFLIAPFEEILKIILNARLLFARFITYKGLGICGRQCFSRF